MKNKINRDLQITSWLSIFLHLLFMNLIIILSKFIFLEEHINPFIFLFLRNLFSFIILLPITFKIFLRTFKSHKYHVSFKRSFAGILAISLWSYAYAYIPLSTATTLTFLVPLITVALARIFFYEKLKVERLVVILISFLAVIYALRPSFGSANIYYIITLIAVVLWSFSNIFRKQSAAAGDIKVFICYYSMWSIILTFLVALPFFYINSAVYINYKIIVFAFFCGVLTVLANLLSFNNYKNNEVGVVQSFDFLKLVIMGFADVLIFNSQINPNIFVGSVVIIACSAWMLYHENKKIRSINLKKGLL